MNYQSAGAVDDHQHFPGLDRVRVSAGTAADIGRTKGCLWDYRLHLVVADFTRLEQVADLADMLTVAMPALDVLVNNAAVGAPERYTCTQDGHEVAFQVNYLAPYMLTTKLSSELAGACGRVINVSSVTPVPISSWSCGVRSSRSRMPHSVRVR
jgi:NAD(P)-dependent dehydrogenase (short-subunit alcohol dehydrogenase family)